MKVPLLDLRSQYDSIRHEVETALREVLESQQFVLGPAVERFEREMEAYTAAKHAIGVASGSDALLIALLALRIGPGDTVVTTSFSFFATASAVVRAGARLVFADIDPETFNLSPASVEEALDRVSASAGRVAIQPVHLYGRLAPIEQICRIAVRRGAHVVEDAAQAVGARGPAMAGTFGAFGALSFFPSKNLGGAGDAGMLLTNDDALAERARMLRVHGSRRRYEHDELGVNSRLDSIQAAFLSVKLSRIDRWNAQRRDRARLYGRLFREARLDPGPVRGPGDAGEEHVFHQYVIRAADRDRLRTALANAGVDTQVYYPIPLHLQPCFAALGGRQGDLVETERAAKECLALPIYPELRDEQIDYVVSTVRAFYGG